MQHSRQLDPAASGITEKTVRRCCFSKGKTLLISVTEQCNQSCLHCMRSAILGRVKPLNLADIAPSIRSAISELEPEKVVISGGEPTLLPNLDHLIELIQNAGCNQISLCTNALKIDINYARGLYKSGLASATVGIEGVGADYDFFRQSPGSFQRMKRGVEALSLAGIRVTLNISLWNGIIGSAKQIAESLSQDRLSGITVTSPMLAGRAESYQDKFDRLTDNNIQAFLNELRSSFSLPISLRRPSCDQSDCPSGKEVFSLSSDWRVQGCLDVGSTNVLDL